MSKRVVLSEQELRRIIGASLQERHHSSIGHLQEADAPVTQIEWEAPIPLDKINTAEINYLIAAFNQFSPVDITIAQKSELPTDEKSPRAIKAYLSTKSKKYGFTVATWPGSGTLEEQQQVAFEYVRLMLKCKIIDLLNDETNVVNPRYVFFIDDSIYRRDVIEPKTALVLQDIAAKLSVTNAYQFNSLEFFGKLDDVAFVEKISDPEKGTEVAGPLKNPNPTAFYIDAGMADKFNKYIKDQAQAAFDYAVKIISQYDSDYVESFFCTPLVYPDTWKRYCFDEDHPLATPWRQSYVVMNVASQAASVKAGPIALYAKLMSYYTKGTNIQAGEKTGFQDPFVTTGMFMSLNESKKILVTLSELRRIIDAALLAERTPAPGTAASSEPGMLSKVGKWIKGVFTSDPEIEKTATSTAARAFRRGGKYSDELQKASRVFPGLASALDNTLKNASGTFNKDLLKGMLSKIITPTGAGEEVERTKQILINTIVNIAEQLVDGNKKLDEVILDVIGAEYSDVLVGDLSQIQNWSQPLRDNVARMITNSANGEILSGQASIDELAKLLEPAAKNIAINLRDELFRKVNGVSIPMAPGVAGNRTLSFNPDTRVLSSKTSSGAVTNYDLNKPSSIEDVTNKFGAAGRALFENAVNYVTQTDALSRGAMMIDGVETPISQIAAKNMIDKTLTGVPDALVGATVSPNTARKVAKAGVFQKHTDDVDVTISKLDALGRSGKTAEIGLFRGEILGSKKYGRTLAPGSTSRAKALSSLYIVNRTVLGAPVRGAARFARAIFGDINVFGRFADLLATSGFYSTLVGLVAFNYIAGQAASKTPGARSQDVAGMGLMGMLDALVPDGPLNLGLLNFMLEGSAQAVEQRMNSVSDTVRLCLQSDPLAAYEQLANALRAYYVEVDVSPLLYPALSSKPIDAGYRTSFARFTSGLGAMFSSIFKDENIAKIDAAADKAIADADVVLTELTKQEGATTANEAWKSLESSRKSSNDTVLEEIQTSQDTGTGESVSGIAGYQSVLTKYYTPTTQAATFDPVTNAVSAFGGWLFGAENDAGDFKELYDWFRASALGKTPMIKLGVSDPDNAQQVEKINAKLKELAEKYYKMTTLAAAREEAAAKTSPAPGAPAANPPAP